MNFPTEEGKNKNRKIEKILKNIQAITNKRF